MPPRIPWQFTDPTDSSFYVWEINPNDDGSLQYEKTVSYKNTSAPDGKTIAFEGRDAPLSTSFSGVILTESQYDAMVTWFNKRHQIQIEDDLGRVFYIYITKFSPKRKRSRSYPWRHEYTCEYFILDWE